MAVNTGQFSGVKITNLGKIIIAQSLKGQKVDIENIVLGDGLLEDNVDYETLTSVKHEVMRIPIAEFNVLENGQYEVTFTFDNKNLTEGFWHREIGILASVDGGPEQLYAYAYAGTRASWIYDNSTPISERILKASFRVGNTDNFTIKLGSLAYVTREVLEKEVRETLATHTDNNVLDHPDGSVTVAKLADMKSLKSGTYNGITVNTKGLVTQAVDNKYIGNLSRDITTAQDWNYFTTPGIYKISAAAHNGANAPGKTLTDVPIATTGTLVVVEASSGAISQFYTQSGNNNGLTSISRTRYAGAWGSWTASYSVNRIKELLNDIAMAYLPLLGGTISGDTTFLKKVIVPTLAVGTKTKEAASAEFVQNELLAMLTDVQFMQAVINAIGKQTLASLGVKYNFDNPNAWSICFGRLFGGLIIQGGSADMPQNVSYVDKSYPINFTNKLLAVIVWDINATSGVTSTANLSISSDMSTSNSDKFRAITSSNVLGAFGWLAIGN